MSREDLNKIFDIQREEQDLERLNELKSELIWFSHTFSNEEMIDVIHLVQDYVDTTLSCEGLKAEQERIRLIKNLK